MSLSMALSSALSGLTLSARGTQIVANNIANAQTEAYGVRSLAQSARALGDMGAGVTAIGTIRHTNPALIAEVRNVTAQSNRNSALGAFWQGVEGRFGLPGDNDSLTDRLVGFETALQNASILPDQPAVLLKAVQAGGDIAQKLNDLDQLLQQERDTADAMIAQDIVTLNNLLEEISDLNRDIQRQTLLGGEPAGLIDARQALVDRVSGLIPVREFPREDGRILLMGEDGSILVDRNPARFEFTRTVEPAANERVENGALSLVSINGREIASSSALFSTGRIGAHLHIRDQSAPQMQDALDRLAADLVTRFSSLDVDPSLGFGDAGFFSINGVVVDPTDITGFAGRIRLNPEIDPGAGGEIWRLRDGLGATVPGNSVNNFIIGNMIEALNRPTLLQDQTTPARSAHNHMTDLLGKITTDRLRLDQSTSQSSTKLATLRETLASEGVDSDAELSRLLILEQAYSANARVIATVDSMLRTILEL